MYIYKTEDGRVAIYNTAPDQILTEEAFALLEERKELQAKAEQLQKEIDEATAEKARIVQQLKEKEVEQTKRQAEPTVPFKKRW